MNVLILLIPVSLILGFFGLLAFLWTLRHRQYEDLEGDAARILLEDRDPEDDGTGRLATPHADTHIGPGH
ncbi:cbb3-type cytochrome oxidase assembly protein CcoS [Jannaschia donghaensis]|uniref:Cytochrome oxidase maturation protein, cbb3-type n=1 Tax=Jannaschia donghaensis TaxID=420998 RepID=A0A0M6YKC2_9RHOB|nr:cbb3-type cytochrome oxidase assembly protein CcoS [Jannaschia donghaensis]CTQ49496.1 cytochrome oxidase maturation protein, cbb3-type [Jannaschia donghaensis]